MSVLSTIETNLTIGDVYDVMVTITYDNVFCDECINGFDLQEYLNEVGQLTIRHHRYSIKMDIQDKVLALAEFGPGYQNIKNLLFEYLKDDVKETAKFAIIGLSDDFKEFRLYPYSIDGHILITVNISKKNTK